jgi:hypothetical protein
MAYDEYRERRRFDRESEAGRGEFGRRTFDRGMESRWPGESSWGYGREYDEGDPERFRSTSSRPFDDEGRPELTGGATELHPQTTHRYGLDRPGIDVGWQPSGGYGAGSGFLYGWSPSDAGLSGTPTTRWRSEFVATETWREPSYYGTSRHLASIPRGRFTGKGPKGYQRSDERIREDINEELARDGELDASDIDVRVQSCEVTLEGEVETREQKRLAEDLVEACPGVREVNNNLHVRKGFFARLFGTDTED